MRVRNSDDQTRYAESSGVWTNLADGSYRNLLSYTSDSALGQNRFIPLAEIVPLLEPSLDSGQQNLLTPVAGVISVSARITASNLPDRGICPS